MTTAARVVAATLVALVVAVSAAAARVSDPPVEQVAAQIAGTGSDRAIVYAVRDGRRFFASRGKPLPVRTSPFPIGSVTKSFTAAIVLQLVDERRLRLGDTLARWLPGAVAFGPTITIRDLLQHRSGLADYVDPRYNARVAARDTHLRVLERMAAHGPVTSRGKWAYSNTNYLALGLVIERVTGQSYARELARRIVKPLTLKATKLGHLTSRIDAHAWSAGAIVSSVEDLEVFFHALLEGDLVSPAMKTAMRQTIATGMPGVADGLGIFRANLPCGPAWGHSGLLPPWVTMVYATETRFAVVAFHAAPTPGPDASTLICD